MKVREMTSIPDRALIKKNCKKSIAIGSSYYAGYFKIRPSPDFNSQAVLLSLYTMFEFNNLKIERFSSEEKAGM